jgi:hypothetical protein
LGISISHRVDCWRSDKTASRKKRALASEVKPMRALDCVRVASSIISSSRQPTRQAG